MTTREAGNGRWRLPRIVLASALALAFSASASGASESSAGVATAVFAGGCFWCMEPPFDKLEGVVSTTSGYTGGQVPNPTYEAVSSGGTGHIEAVRIEYDPNIINYERLLEVFWPNIDPTDDGGQFCDRGSQYRAAIFYRDEAQRAAAERSRAALERSKPFRQEIVTEIIPATTFYPAEAYHQDYYLKNPLRYKFYRTGCGRDRRLEALWGGAAGNGEKLK